MYVFVIGSAPGESQIIIFDDGSIVTIDCTTRRKANYSIEIMRDRGLDFDKVLFNVVTHFHDDHIKGISDLIAACPNSRIAIPDAWSNDVFKSFVASFDPSIALAKNTVTKEVSRIFNMISNFPGRLVLLSERMMLHPSPGSSAGAKEWITILTPTNQRKIKYLAEMGALVLAGEFDKVREYGIENKNATSVSCLVEKVGERIFLAGDIENLDGFHDVDYVSQQYFDNVTSINLVKMPHHGSETSFSKSLRGKIDDKSTVVAITPYPKGRKFLPNDATLAHLDQAQQVWVMSGRKLGLDRQDRTIHRYPFRTLVPVREFTPGVLEYCDGGIATTDCMKLDKYLDELSGR